MRLWCSQPHLARVIVAVSYCSTRNDSSSISHVYMGSIMEVIHHPGMLRQHGSCMCTFIGVSLLMHLLQCLHYIFQIVSRARHIAGVHHSAVNAMSRDRYVFLSCFAQTPCSLSGIPKALLDMLLHTNCNPMSKPFFRQLCRKHPHRMF